MKIYNPFNYLRLIFGSKNENFNISFPSCTTISGYDNLDAGDDPHKSCIPDGCATDIELYKQFLRDHHIVAVLQADWDEFQYWIINLSFEYNGQSYSLQGLEIWDYCNNDDCTVPMCCTNNAKEFGCNFLIDIEKTSLPSTIDYNDLLVKSTSLEFIRQMSQDEVNAIKKKYKIQ